MRKLPNTPPAIHPTPVSLIRLQRHILSTCRPHQPLRSSHRPFFSAPSKSLAQLRPEHFSEIWFTSTSPRSFPSAPPPTLEPSSSDPDTENEPRLDYSQAPQPPKDSDHPTPSAYTLALGRTLHELLPLLPTLLLHPLPPHLLSRHITLHLFPSTHPHLPAVKGRVAYRAALWTAPVAWGQLPIVGDVKLQILSERVVRTGLAAETSETGNGDEKLVVRWRTEGKTSSSRSPTETSASSVSSATDTTNRNLSSLLGGDQPLLRLPKDPGSGQFSGMFIFTFDEEGRISTHTIEHADEGTGWDRTARVVTVADWLLGRVKGAKDREPELGLAYTSEWEGWGSTGRLWQKRE